MYLFTATVSIEHSLGDLVALFTTNANLNLMNDSDIYPTPQSWMCPNFVYLGHLIPVESPTPPVTYNSPNPIPGYQKVDAAKTILIVGFAWLLVIFGSAAIKEEGVAQIEKETRTLAPNREFEGSMVTAH